MIRKSLLAPAAVIACLAGAAPAAHAALARPSASFTYSPSSPQTGQSVLFDASASTCPAAPCTYTWVDDTDDGVGGTTWSLGTGVRRSFTFKYAGTKYVRVTVRDRRGRASSASRTVVVTAPTSTPPPPPPTSPPPPPPPPTSPPPPPPPTSGTCDLSATPTTFASEVSAATAGQTICLASGSYGTWSGAAKAITIRPQDGAVTTMNVSFTTGDSGFTLDGMSGMGGAITNGARDITIRNAAFTSQLVIDGVANSNIVLEHNTHNNINLPSDCAATPARIHLSYYSTTHSGVTVKDSLFDGGNADGVQSGAGVNLIGNEFRNIQERSGSDCAHSDPIQLIGAPGSIVRGNYIHHSADGIVAYDGLEHALIERNVVDLVNGRWGIELYSDQGSIVRHNTLVYGTGCAYAPCGYLILDHKSSDPAGSGTVVVDNIATVISANNGSTMAERHNNMVRQGVASGDMTGTPLFSGGSFPTTYAGFVLATGSPGRTAASDGTDVGR